MTAWGLLHSRFHRSYSRWVCHSNGHSGGSPGRPSAGRITHPAASDGRSRRRAFGSGGGPDTVRAPPRGMSSSSQGLVSYGEPLEGGSGGYVGGGGVVGVMGGSDGSVGSESTGYTHVCTSTVDPSAAITATRDGVHASVSVSAESTDERITAVARPTAERPPATAATWPGSGLNFT